MVGTTRTNGSGWPGPTSTPRTFLNGLFWLMTRRSPEWHSTNNLPICLYHNRLSRRPTEGRPAIGRSANPPRNNNNSPKNATVFGDFWRGCDGNASLGCGGVLMFVRWSRGRTNFERRGRWPWNFLDLEDFPERTFLVDDQGPLNRGKCTNEPTDSHQEDCWFLLKFDGGSVDWPLLYDA